MIYAVQRTSLNYPVIIFSDLGGAECFDCAATSFHEKAVLASNVQEFVAALQVTTRLPMTYITLISPSRGSLIFFA